MGKTYDRLDDRLRAFIAAQKLFFVATAPLARHGHVNLSPKGHDSLVVLGDTRVAYADLGGSGIETVAHVRENARITIMFCAFEGPANILRLYGSGHVIQYGEDGFAEAMAWFPSVERARNVIVVDIHRIADSCGWGVPLYEYQGDRDQLPRWAAARPEDEWMATRYEKNARSLDDLPGLVSSNTGTED